MRDRFTKEEEEVLDFLEMKEKHRVDNLLGKKPTKKKLVRDLIPGIIAEEGKEVRMCTEINGDSKIPYYFEKVQEELEELKEAWKDHLIAEGLNKWDTFNKTVEEGADLKEAVDALFKVLEIKDNNKYLDRPSVASRVDSAQIIKKVSKGGFSKGFIMEFDIEEEE